jgi:hypothetical protein
MRYVFSGGAGGYLQTSPIGRSIAGGGQSHVGALLNAAQAMGISSYAGCGGTGSKSPLAEVGS